MSTDGGPELPRDLKNDEVVIALWTVFMLLVPPLWVNADEPLLKRFWAWRYIYLAFAVSGVVYFSHGLLAGHYLLLGAVPFAHLVAPLSIMATLAGFQIPGVEFPMVSDGVVAAVYAGVIAVAIGVETLRRVSPELLVSKPFEHDDGEFVVPLKRVDEQSEGSETPPTLDQSVSTAFIGETGSGKTSTMETFAYQLPYDDETAVIAHDVGDDFQRFFADLGFEVIRISASDGDAIWNLFRDVTSEADFREITGAIFGEPSGYDPFHNQAKQVFTATLTYLYREADKQNRRDEVSHLDLLSLLNRPRWELRKRLARYEDLESTAGYLSDDSGKSAANVYGTVHEHVDPVFVGDFGDYGEFSIEEYIQNPAGRVLIIDSDPSRMETLGPMFQVLLDWSIRYAMDAATPTVHLLDEIDQLPPLTQLGDLAARGRSENARALIGVQTVGQLKTTYESPSAVLGNCPQGVYFGPGDQETTDYVLSEVGETREMTRMSSYSRSRSTPNATLERARDRESFREQDRTPITSGTLKQFGPGECVVKSRTEWWTGEVHQLEVVKAQLPDTVTPPDSTDATTSGTDGTEGRDGRGTIAGSLISLGNNGSDERRDRSDDVNSTSDQDTHSDGRAPDVDASSSDEQLGDDSGDLGALFDSQSEEPSPPNEDGDGDDGSAAEYM